MLRTQLELKTPKFCLLGQAVNWLNQPGSPILDYVLHKDVTERDLAYVDRFEYISHGFSPMYEYEKKEIVIIVNAARTDRE